MACDIIILFCPDCSNVMQNELFRNWLENEYLQSNGRALARGTYISRIANCSTIERCEGNLDVHFNHDGMAELLNRLSYTASDRDAGRRPSHQIPIDGDIVNGSSTHRSAANLYRKFRVAQELGLEMDKQADEEHGPVSTERQALSMIRVGQQRYRYMVLERWDYRCAVTKASILLTASHIKPWCLCSDDERLDPSNGICLSPLFDKAFDAGIITFRFDGHMLLSPAISKLDARKLGLALPTAIKGFTKKNRHFLEYHQHHVWRRV